MRWFFCLRSSAARAFARSRADEKARICSSRRRRAWYVMLLHACRRVDSVVRAAQGGRLCKSVACLSARRGAWRSIALSRRAGARAVRRSTQQRGAAGCLRRATSACLPKSREHSQPSVQNPAPRPSRATKLELHYKTRTAHRSSTRTVETCVSSHRLLCVQQCMLWHR